MIGVLWAFPMIVPRTQDRCGWMGRAGGRGRVAVAAGGARRTFGNGPPARSEPEPPEAEVVAAERARLGFGHEQHAGASDWAEPAVLDADDRPFEPGLIISQSCSLAPGDSSVITVQPLLITSDLPAALGNYKG